MNQPYEQCWLMNTVGVIDHDTIGKEHQAYINSLERRGLLVAAGAFRDESGMRHGTGLIIVRARTRAEAEAIAAEEPYIANGLRTLTLVPWQRSRPRSALPADTA